jgi:hypothetical protein
MTEPLDPDTLAEGERLVGKARAEGGMASLASLEWLVTHAAALLAVARDHREACEKRDYYQAAYEEESELHGELRGDHARLTAENERLLNLLRGWERLTPDEAGRIPAQAGYWLAERVDALSAEAGDTDG